MQFIAYALNTQNMAKLAQGDWLIPVAPAAATAVVKSTKHYGSWRNAISAVPSFKKANWVSLTNYPRWKAEVATPAFRPYLGNQSRPGHADQAPDRRMEQHSRHVSCSTEEATCARPAAAPAGRKPDHEAEGAGRR